MRKLTIDIDEALADPIVDFVMDLWGQARGFLEAPAFSGGVLDSWPALAVECFPMLRNEDSAIDAYLRHQKEKSDG